ncbi:MAG: ribonuclease J [Pseudomonadota bacterium]
MSADGLTGTNENELVFLPLGGCEEIGMNVNAYGYGPANNRRWIIADLGVTFGSLETPGVDIITADISYLDGEQIDAIFLTHAHEDHIGAAGLLWPRLRAPMYATPFTAELVRHKLLEHGIDEEQHLNVIPQGSTISVGPFTVKYVTLTHSIPEPNALAIKTPAGMLLHTGDWKIDPDPLVGDQMDEETLSTLGDEGVLAMICDSTNVFEEGEAGSEATVRDALIKLVGEQTGRVAVTTFASNVARVESVIRAAEANGRHVCLVGRSMHRVTTAAKAVGMLDDVQPFIDEEEAGYLPSDAVLYLCTGSQGEPRAALGRIARDQHRNVVLGADDVVIFSSRVIPGNEKGIFEMMNALADKGVRLITPKMVEDPIHVSGHPCRDELRRMYQWVRPKIAVPVHGERRHTLEHAAYAKSLQIPHAVTPKNGDMVRLAPGQAHIVDTVPAGKMYLDGNVLVPEGSIGMAERQKLSWFGVVFVTLAIDDDLKLADGPIVVARGFSEPDGSAADESLVLLEDAAELAFDRMKRRGREDDDIVERDVGRATRKACEQIFGRKPVIDVTVLRV